MFKDFTNQVDSLNSYITIYKEQLKTSSIINNFNQSGKKKYINDGNDSSLEEISDLKVKKKGSLGTRFKMGPHNFSEKKKKQLKELK
jgi:hypothetical protein